MDKANNGFSFRFPMQSVVALLTAAAFTLHFTLGCCAHHGHGAVGAHSAAQKAHVHRDHNHGHSHGHQHSAPESEPAQHPGGSHDDCHENHCTFLAAGKFTVVLETLSTMQPAVTLDVAFPPIASSSTSWLSDMGDQLRLPVRLHLFHQVLLN
jgi:hypothetical protein